MVQSLQKRNHSLAFFDEQRRIIQSETTVKSFERPMNEVGLSPLFATGIQTFQINVGKMCNQVCKHCHVDAGPDRKEIMTKETMQHCLDALEKTDAPIVDLTGGAPEMNPDFCWLVDQIASLKRHLIVRSNLTILVTKGYENMPVFLTERKAEITASLPYYLDKQTDAQRGDHVFEKSIKALQRLNELGYGQPDTGLILNLVYNPVGAYLPPQQAAIESDYKKELGRRYGIVFNQLYTVTNMPISRFLDFLLESGNYDAYMRKLEGAFNPEAAKGVMCRTTLSIGWDGRLYDCDFNQMLGLPVNHNMPAHIRDFDPARLATREICIGNHCYGCTAGSGSSCTGTLAGPSELSHL